MVEFCYKVLNLGLYKSRGKITDELVKRNYDESIKRCEEKGIRFFGSKEALEEYKNILEFAYMNLKTKELREQYDQLINMEKSYEKIIKSKDRKKTTKPNNKGKITRLNEKMKKSPTTKEMVEQIVKQAKEEYPISKPEELER